MGSSSKLSFWCACLGFLLVGTNVFSAVVSIKPGAKTVINSASTKNWYGFFNAPFVSLGKSTKTAVKTWQEITLVEDVDVCCGMDVSSPGKMHISYYDDAVGGVAYLTNQSGEWETFVIDSGLPSIYESLDETALVYADSTAHVIYTDHNTTPATLRYASKQDSESTWSKETIEEAGRSDGHGYFTEISLSIDSNGFAHVVCMENTSSTSYELQYWTNQSGNFVEQSLAGSNSSYVVPGLVLDSSNYPHVVYYDLDDLTLEHTTNTTGTWVSETIDSLTASILDFDSAPTVITDSSGSLHVSYQASSLEIKYATNKSGRWRKQTVATSSDEVGASSLVVDSSGNVGVVYTDEAGSLDSLTYSSKSIVKSIVWSKTVVASSSPTGWAGNAFKSDSADDLYLAFKSDGYDLKYVSTYLDFDGDGTIDADDTDDDGDGVLDDDDILPNDSSETTDTDGDGTGNNADTDDDGDGTLDADDAFPNDSSETTDTDGDGTGNNTDTDDDGDGLEDSVDSSPLVDDADGDGIIDGDDPDYTDSDGDGTVDSQDDFGDDPNESSDTDGDGIGDNTDSDDDNDGISDDEDTDTHGGR